MCEIKVLQRKGIPKVFVSKLKNSYHLRSSGRSTLCLAGWWSWCPPCTPAAPPRAPPTGRHAHQQPPPCCKPGCCPWCWAGQWSIVTGGYRDGSWGLKVSTKFRGGFQNNQRSHLFAPPCEKHLLATFTHQNLLKCIQQEREGSLSWVLYSVKFLWHLQWVHNLSHISNVS